MNSPIIRGLLFTFKKNLDYGTKLVHDLTDDQMVAQPAEDPERPSNHPAWVLSHLNVYLPVIQSIIRGEEFEDPKPHKYGMLSKPLPDPNAYDSKTELVEQFVSGHEQIVQQLEQLDDSIFGQETKLPRWKEVMPIAGVALPYLMCNHENIHLGQVSAWRRIQGMPSV